MIFRPRRTFFFISLWQWNCNKMSSCPEIYVNSLNWSVEILNIAPNICPNLRSLNLFSARSDFNDSVCPFTLFVKPREVLQSFLLTFVLCHFNTFTDKRGEWSWFEWDQGQWRLEQSRVVRRTLPTIWAISIPSDWLAFKPVDTHPSSEDKAKTEDALNAYKVIKTSTFIHSLRDKSLLYIKRNSGILSRVNMIYRSKLNGGRDPPKDQVIPWCTIKTLLTSLMTYNIVLLTHLRIKGVFSPVWTTDVNPSSSCITVCMSQIYFFVGLTVRLIIL